MTMLILLSLPFSVLGYLWPSWRMLFVPYVAWLGFAVLERLGMLPGASSEGAVILAGSLGALCAAAGVMLGRTRRPGGAKS